jgi:glycosyltransferase involved in cell wall biosynthesis
VVALPRVRILLDYRPALRERTGVGEYVHELARALTGPAGADEVSILTTSWKDRPSPGLSAALGGVRVVDWRLPVRSVTWAWHHLGWPPVEWLAGPADVVHAQSPLLIPARDAAQVVTIHDLDFLHHPERAAAEMRRDFPRLVRDHVRRADHVVVSSRYAAREVVGHLNLPVDKVTVCSPGAAAWALAVGREREKAKSQVQAGSILFVGTIEPRKNVPRLLEAYATLRARRTDVPPLVLAGQVREGAQGELQRLQAEPLSTSVSVLGYVTEAKRRELFRDARMLVLPSLEEGFGLPVLEAMASGVPVVISNRGALPEVAGNAATPVDPLNIGALATAMERLLDPSAAHEAIDRGRHRAAEYSWDACAESARSAYRAAIAARARRTR